MKLKLGSWLLTTLLLTSTLIAQTPTSAYSSCLLEMDVAKIQDRWIVTSVEHDGPLPPAQFGQRVGDVITFSENDTGMAIT